MATENEALPEPCNSGKFHGKFLSTGAFCPDGVKEAFMQTFARARTRPVRPCPYSIMPLPALSTNAGYAKACARGFASRPDPCKTQTRAPAAADA